MKRLLLIQTLAIFIVVGFSGSLFALPAEVKLEFTGVDPYQEGRVAFPTLGEKNVLYGQYNFNIDWDSDGIFDGTIGGFCVEDVYAPPQNRTYIYDVVDVTEDTTNKFFMAAYVLSNAYGLSDEAKQLAIWETVFDGASYDNDGSYSDTTSLSSSSFYVVEVDSDDVDEAQNFLNSLDWNGLAGFDAGGYKILRNEHHQDYLVSVPDASLMYLLGPALIGLGLLGRRKNG